ncbi:MULTISPECIES: hypothetical protein [Staphylococcus]|nr:MULTISPECIES: hypothetical protein [Staphylococcus]
MTRDFNKIILFDVLGADVHCDVCGNRVEPFKALANLVNKYSEFN